MRQVRAHVWWQDLFTSTQRWPTAVSLSPPSEDSRSQVKLIQELKGEVTKVSKNHCYIVTSSFILYSFRWNNVSITFFACFDLQSYRSTIAVTTYYSCCLIHYNVLCRQNLGEIIVEYSPVIFISVWCIQCFVSTSAAASQMMSLRIMES